MNLNQRPLVDGRPLFDVFEQVAVPNQDLETVRVLFGNVLGQCSGVPLVGQHVLQGLVQLDNMAQTDLERLLYLVEVIDALEIQLGACH